jgi:hypothetical protein
MTVSYSYSTTQSESFTLAHAKKLAAKVIADMHQCHRLYGRPIESDIARYQEELIVLLAGGYISQYEFGFKTKADKRVVSWKYTVTNAGDLEGGRSGGLFAAADVDTSRFFNYLWHSGKWSDLTIKERMAVETQYTLQRTTGDPPADGNGRWIRDRRYVSGGVAIQREEFQPWE